MRIVVAGLYNSGSSALAGVLHHLGVDMGSPYWEFQGKGGQTYEPYDLSCVLRHFWGEPVGEQRTATETQRTILRNWIRMRETVDESMHHGAKHPLICLSLNDLAVAWSDQPLVFLWSRRDLETSIRKLNERQWFRPEHADRIQRKLWHAADVFFRDCSFPHLIVDHEPMMKQKAETVNALIEFLNLSPTENQRKQALDSIWG